MKRDPRPKPVAVVAPAIGVLLERHMEALLGFVRRHADPVVLAHESCTDVAQSVCLGAVRDFARFDYRGEGPFRSWLFRRAMVTLIDRRRYYLAAKRARERTWPDRPAPWLDDVQAEPCSPSEAAMRSEDVARLERAFARLPADYQRVIRQAYVLDLRRAELAHETGRSEGAVRVLLARALARLGLLMHADMREAVAGGAGSVLCRTRT